MFEFYVRYLFPARTLPPSFFLLLEKKDTGFNQYPLGQPPALLYRCS
ncbi:hypothetical protein CLOSTHATH_06476 [Hungatella hathewayi DSM 13479]|uniref:Uncharacterized protein n=1 Tax=Hungatella hathewayi DSM 13479 TaxID=566550 RepID=D3AS69_9FIRM|nr:hypothetical protein CLOSTHATH_06476 [Hungatella hathewayi DSM 13479]